MNSVDEKFLEATKNILEKNLLVNNIEYVQNPIILVYDFDSILSTKISE
jgi:hypothetical protein